MKTVRDIKVIVYSPADRSERITSAFLQLKDKEFIPYRDDRELSEILSGLKASGFDSKEVLVLKKYPGRIFQKCPGSRGTVCCNYSLLNTCFGCLYGCTYCFLNSYINFFGMMQFTHMDDMADEIRRNTGSSGFIKRTGTGEYTDSLMMDETTGIGSMLIHSLAYEKNLLLEFKTKSSNVDHLLKLPGRDHTVLAWTLNTEKAVYLYEKGTADLGERLAAAKRAQDAGFLLAFHFDPFIRYEGMEQDYEGLVHRLFSVIDPSRTVWISMGGFRYSTGFPEAVSPLFPEEQLTTGELFPCADGKYRYIRGFREKMYRMLKNAVREYSSKPFVYMCMETGDMWKDVFDMDLSSSDDLEAAMSQHLRKEFGL